MFVQVIRGMPSDRTALFHVLERWHTDVGPGAEGFLGATAGLATDGQFLLVARFADEEAARRNSDREEQRAWWATAERAFAGRISFFDSSEVDVSMGGGSDDAGFVQVLFGRGERERAREVLAQGEAVLRRERPDIIGGFTAWQADGGFIDVAYFRSEAEARAGESQEMSAAGRELFEQLAAVMPVHEYVDLPDPRFA